MKNRTKRATFPEWALHITALRERLEINQAELARRMDCSAMTISRWERGLLQPSAEHFIQLGNLGNKNEAWFFWEMAGIQPAKVIDALGGPAPRRKLSDVPHVSGNSGHESRSLASQTENLVSVPVLKAIAGTQGAAGDKRSSLRSVGATSTVDVPRSWCPNPSYTSLLVVKGHAMEPLIRDGDLIAVDSFQTEKAELYGELVIAASEPTGLCVSRLRRYDTLDVLEAADRKFEAVILSRSSRGRIVGKVLWWISGVHNS